ncbi:MAG: hypothetical protein RIM23_06030 [Coleofasciculus sp. G3-WIS-01]
MPSFPPLSTESPIRGNAIAPFVVSAILAISTVVNLDHSDGWRV